jgi:hypothetical protein
VPQLADQKTGQDVDAGDQDAGYRTGNPHREFHKLDSFVVPVSPCLTRCARRRP